MPLSPYEETLLEGQEDNPYRQTLIEQQQRRESALRTSAKVASSKTPDQQAEILKTSAKTGLPAPLVNEQTPKTPDVNDPAFWNMLRDNPKLAEYLSDPDNAALSQDDHDGLGTIEQMLTYGANALRSIGAAFPSTNAAVWGLFQAPADLLSDYVGKPLFDGSDPFAALSKRFGEYRRQQERVAERVRPEAGGFVEQATYQGLESLGQNLLMLIPGMAAARPGMVLGGMGAVTGGQAYGQAREQGVGPERAAMFALSQGLVEIATEKIPVNTLFKGLVQNTGFLRLMTQSLASELPGEQVATILQDINEWSVLPENAAKTFRDYLEERPSAAAATAIATIVGTMGQVGVARVMDRAFLKSAGEAVKQSKTGERMPEKLREFVAGLTEGTPMENVYVPLQDAQTYFQSQNIDPGEFFDSVTDGGRERYEQALATGEDLEIPFADYATRVLPSEHAGGLEKIVRLGDPLRMNQQEGEALAAESQESLKETPESVKETSAARVREDIVGQLQGQGFTPETVQAYAKLYESAFRTLGERSGMDPFELYERYRLKITRPIPEILRNLPSIDTKLDPLIDRLRAGTVPTQRDMFGTSLVDFLREAGGVLDDGGDLASREPDKGRKPFERNLLRPEGLPLDRARELAAEAGYIDAQLSIPEFIDVISNEIGGTPVFAAAQQNPDAIEQSMLLEQLEEYLKSRDVDVTEVTNEEIRQLLQESANVPEIDPRTGTVLEQPAFHGSPHKFNKFSLHQIGTGEGTQSVGYGLYFASQKEVAEVYKQLGQQQTGAGHLYTVEIPEDSEYLDWDKPVREQSPQVQTVLQDVFAQLGLPGALNANPTGQTAYQWIADEQGGSHQAASEILAHAGVPGLRYLDRLSRAEGEGTHNYVIFDDRLIDIVSLEQSFNAGRRGQIRFGKDRKFTIELLEKADLSTFLHETGHFFLETFGDVVDELQQNPDALDPTQQQMVADYQAALGWLGVSSREEIQTAHHEQWARGFEAYLREGKTPNPELRSIFARFRAWLQNIYRSLTQLNVQLTPEVTAVFDRLVASDEQIQRAEQEAGILALIEDEGMAERMGLSREEFALYRKQVQDASDARRTELLSEYMDEYQRYSEEWYKARRAEVRDEVAKEVYEQRDYIALAFLQKGTLPDGSPLPNGIEGMKLDAKSLEAQYGKASRKPGKGSTVMNRLLELRVYARENGVPADQVAQLLGYSSGDELVQALVKTRDPQALIEAETDSRMRDQYGDVLTDGTAAEKARDAVMSRGRSEVIQAEMEALAKKVQEVAPYVNFALRKERREQRESRQAGIGAVRAFFPTVALARGIAEQRIAQMRVRDIRPGLYLAAARREGLRALEAVNKGDFVKALEAKQKELINVEMYRAARETQKSIEKTREYMRSFDEPKKRGRIGKAGEDYLDQIDALRDRFDFGRLSQKQIDRRKSLLEWVQEQQAQGLPVDLPPEMLNEARRQNYQDATVEVLEGLRDSVEMIEHLARLKNKLLKSKDKREFNAAVDDMVASIRKHGGGKRANPIETRLPGDAGARRMSKFFASHRKLHSFLREMDGFQDGGVMWERIMRPINEAADDEATRVEQATRELNEIFKNAYRGEESALYRKTFIPEINNSLSKMGRLMVALNWGNADNRQRLMDGRKWNESQVRAILDTLDERDWKFVQSIWDHINSYWKEISDKEQRVTGVRPEKVEASPFVNSFGKEMKGGYFPIAYERQLTARAGSNEDADFAKSMQQASYARATTRRGHTQARVENVREPVRLDFDVIFEHVNQVIHDLTHHEMLIDVGRLLADKRVQDAIYSEHGDIVYDNIKGAIKDVAVGNAPAPDWMKPINSARQGVVTASLGWNFFTSLLQPFQLTNAMARIGPKWVGKGIARWARDAASMENTVRMVHEKSGFMRSRHNTQIREIQELRNKVGLGSPNELLSMVKIDTRKVRAWANDHLHKMNLGPMEASIFADSYFTMIQKAQQIADIPTWLGQYEKSLEAGETEPRAIALADQAVIDSQGSGHIKDLAAVERHAVAKIFTTFYSFQNLLLNQVIEASGKGSIKDPVQAMRKALDLSLLLFVPTAVMYFLSKGLLGGDDEDPVEGLIRAQLAQFANLFVGTRELAGVAEGRDYTGPASMRWASAVGQFSKQLLQGEADEALFRAATQAAGVFFHFPATQVRRTAEGVLALWEGQTSNPAALLFGPPKE